MTAMLVLTLTNCKNNIKPIEYPWYVYINNSDSVNGNAVELINKPYEKILLDLKELKNNINTNLGGIQHFLFADTYSNYDTIVSIKLINKYNMEDEYKIKAIIMKTLPFEPKMKSGLMFWSAGKYDVEIWHNGAGYMELNILEKKE